MNKCLDCERETKGYGKRCYSCANSIKNKGRKLSKETKLKIGKIKKFPQLHKQKYLINQYIKCSKTTVEIAKELGCSKSIVCKQLIKYNIPRRHGYIKHGKCTKDKHHYCIDCNKKITYQSALYGNGRCKPCAQSEKMIGKMLGNKNPAYIHGNGNAPYPVEFNDKLKLKIRKRDNYTCQKCNITEEEHIIVYGKVLIVHHIDYDKQNCKEENLTTLCNECNIRVNCNRDYWYAYFTYIINEEINLKRGK